MNFQRETWEAFKQDLDEHNSIMECLTIFCDVENSIFQDEYEIGDCKEIMSDCGFTETRQLGHLMMQICWRRLKQLGFTEDDLGKMVRTDEMQEIEDSYKKQN